MDPAAPHAPPLCFRSLRETDLPRVMEIERASFSTPWRDTTFRGLLLRGDTDLLAADRAGRLVGYAVCWTVVDQAELGNVAVDPAERGHGVGAALVDQAVRAVAARGAEELFLEVRESNLSAQSVYVRKGFEVVGRRRSYYAEPKEDALVMRLHIHPNH
ncbi:MAG: ribosomal-protein-alanine acetyltransferase [Gemmatimonadetes bacterium]|nr:ribosomal-protein-alanine acetyltransferase [Gemmatimonadota bacterium]